jgi:hypothetical protein
LSTLSPVLADSTGLSVLNANPAGASVSFRKRLLSRLSMLVLPLRKDAKPSAMPGGEVDPGTFPMWLRSVWNR